MSFLCYLARSLVVLFVSFSRKFEGTEEKRSSYHPNFRVAGCPYFILNMTFFPLKTILEINFFHLTKVQVNFLLKTLDLLHSKSELR